MVLGQRFKQHDDFGDEVCGLHFNSDVAERNEHSSTDQGHFIKSKLLEDVSKRGADDGAGDGEVCNITIIIDDMM